MGIGLMFWSVAEPIFHFGSPPAFSGLEGNNPASAEMAMTVTYTNLRSGCTLDKEHDSHIERVSEIEI